MSITKKLIQSKSQFQDTQATNVVQCRQIKTLDMYLSTYHVQKPAKIQKNKAIIKSNNEYLQSDKKLRKTQSTGSSYNKTINFKSFKQEYDTFQDKIDPFQDKDKRLKKYLFLEQIGEGSYGVVYKAQIIETGQLCAIKVINISNSKNSNKKNFTLLSMVQNELLILKRLGNHPNIVKFISYIQTAKNAYIVEEYIHQNLLQIIEEYDCLDEKICKNIIFQILKAIKHCHSKQVIHRDLKLENIMIDLDRNGELLVKIIDFGSSIQINQDDSEYLTDTVGSIIYMAPEVMEGKYNSQCDLWSIGVITFSILTGRFPFKGKSINQIYNQMINLSTTLQFYQSEKISTTKRVRKFIRRLLRRNPSSRLNIENIFKDHWLKKLSQ